MYDLIIINIYRFQCLWIGFHEIDNIGHSFDDAMTWHNDVDNIYMILYDDIYEGCYLGFAGFTCVITCFVGFTRVIT